MELALQMRARSTRLAVQWAPRELNEEADALTNLEFKGFAADRRIPVRLEELHYHGLPAFLEKGKEFYGEVAAVRAAARSGRAGGGTGRAGAGRRSGRGRGRPLSLRERDPW